MPRRPMALGLSAALAVAAVALLLSVLASGRVSALAPPAVDALHLPSAPKPAHTITYTFAANNQGWDAWHPFLSTPAPREPAAWSGGHVQGRTWNYHQNNVLYLISPGSGAPNGLAAISATLSFTHHVSFDETAIQDLRYWVWLGSTKQPLWMCSTPRAMNGGVVSLTIDPQQGGWYRCPNVLGQTPSEPIPQQEMVSVLGGVSYVVVAYHSDTDYCTSQDPAFEYTSCTNHELKWATYTLDDVRLDLYAPVGKLSFGTPKALAGERVLALAQVKGIDGELSRGATGVHLAVAGQSASIPLSDAAADDFRPNDGFYTGVFTAPVGGAHVTLYDGTDLKLDEADLPVLDVPSLAVVTDWPRLYRDFLAAGASAGEDLDANGTDDFYDLIGRVNDYAAAHGGIVFDLDKNITVDQGYAYGYRDLPRSCMPPPWPPGPCPDTNQMGEEIFQFLGRMHATTFHSVQNMVFLGDRDVLPMYENLPDPLGIDREMPTDVPYATYASIRPQDQPRPQPRVAFGRIFARRPYDLAGLIDAFEKPAQVQHGLSSAALYCLPSNFMSDGIDWTGMCQRQYEPFFSRRFAMADGEDAPPYRPGSFYPYLEDVTPWRAISLTQALAGSNLIVAFTHGDPDSNYTPDGQLTVGGYAALPLLQTPLFINAGCHTGLLQYGHSSTAWRTNIVPEIVYRRIGYLAPTTVSRGLDFGLGLDDYMWLHFVDELGQPGATTVGRAWLGMWSGYYAAPKPTGDSTVADLAVSTHAYNKSYFGLPTQRIAHSTAALADVGPASALPAQTTPVRMQANTAHMTVQVDVPAFIFDDDGHGAQVVRPANGGGVYGSLGLPVMPQLLYRFDLPAGATAVTVTEITASRIAQVYGPVTLHNTEAREHCSGCAGAAAQPPATVITQPYPSLTFGYDTQAFPDATRLTLNVIPAQVSPQGMLTLYKRLVYIVDYTAPAAVVGLQNVRLNGGQPVPAGQAGVSLAAELTSEATRALTLNYRVQGPEGQLIAAGSATAQVVTGTQPVNLTVAGAGWPAGPQWLTLSAADSSGTALATANIPFAVLGLRLELAAGALHQNTGLPLAMTLRAWDENGAPAAGLSGHIALHDAGTLVGLTWSESQPGTYHATIPPPALAPGVHTLQAAAVDGRGITTTAAAVQVRIDRERVYLPSLRKGS